MQLLRCWKLRGFKLNEMTQTGLRCALHYDETEGVFTWKSTKRRIKCGQVAGTPNKDGYLRLKVLGKSYFVHRLAWFYVHGKWPECFIDHIDGDIKNNKISNLREANYRQSAQNTKMRRTNRSGFKGVCWHKRTGMWAVTVYHNGNKTALGYYKDVELAGFVAEQAREKYHKEFANERK